MIKRKEPIKFSPQKIISLDTSIPGKEIEPEESPETSPRISSPSVTIGGENQILKEGYRDTKLIEQGLTSKEKLFGHHTLEFDSAVKQLANTKNNKDFLRSSKPSEQPE